MSENGEINTAFGVYRNVCCGREIIIRAGAAFPECPKHPNLPTVWNEVDVDTQDVIIVKKKAQSEPAA